MADAHRNFAISAVATAPSPATSGTSLVITAGEGATRFAHIPPYNAVVCPAGTDPTPANAEIVRVTNRSTDTFTITRAQEGSTARTIVAGDRFYAAVTAKTLTDVESSVSAISSGALAYKAIFGGAVPLATRQMKDWPNAVMSNGTDTKGMSRIAHVLKVGTASIQLMFVNSFNWNAPGDNPITIRASIESPGGTFRPVLFRGVRDITIEPGAVVVSDPTSVNAAAGAVVYSRTYVTVTTGQKWPKATYTVVADGEGAESSTSATDKTLSGTVSNVADRTFAPAWVLGTPIVGGLPSVMGLGDSIVNGQADDGGNNYRIVGWFDRAMTANNVISGSFGLGGDRLAFVLSNAPALGDIRWSYLPAFSTVVNSLGYNDVFTAGDSLATIQGRLTTFWTRLVAMGIRPINVTYGPQTTSTDGWVTVGNQTTVSAPQEAVRTALNDWIRTTPSPLYSYIELADAIESARNSGKFKANYTGDGIHPYPVGHAAMAAVIDAGVVASFI